MRRIYVLAVKQVGADGMAFSQIVDGMTGVRIVSFNATLTDGWHYLYGSVRKLRLIVPRVRYLSWALWWISESVESSVP